MGTVDLKALARRFYDEVLVGGNLDLIDELVDDEFVEHEEYPGIPPGKEGVRAVVTRTREAFPDISVAVEDIIVEGDKTASRVRFSGTHQGEFLGVPPTGNKIDFETVDFMSWRDGKAIEHWGVTDQLALLQQLGVIEPMVLVTLGSVSTGDSSATKPMVKPRISRRGSN